MNKAQLKKFQPILDNLKKSKGNIYAPENYTPDSLLRQIATSINHMLANENELVLSLDGERKTNERLRKELEDMKSNLAKERDEMAAKIHEEIGKGFAHALFGTNLAQSRYFFGR